MREKKETGRGTERERVKSTFWEGKGLSKIDETNHVPVLRRTGHRPQSGPRVVQDPMSVRRPPEVVDCQSLACFLHIEHWGMRGRRRRSESAAGGSAGGSGLRQRTCLDNGLRRRQIVLLTVPPGLLAGRARPGCPRQLPLEEKLFEGKSQTSSQKVC